MAVLSHQIIDTLVELLERRLMEMSNDNHEYRPEYRDLQNCRYSLLALASEQFSSQARMTVERQAAKKFDHLRVIAGGKA